LRLIPSHVYALIRKLYVLQAIFYVNMD